MNTKNRSEMWIAYDKSMAVIQSCENMDQLVIAQNYLNLYKDKFSYWPSHYRLYEMFMVKYAKFQQLKTKSKKKTVTK